MTEIDIRLIANHSVLHHWVSQGALVKPSPRADAELPVDVCHSPLFRAVQSLQLLLPVLFLKKHGNLQSVFCKKITQTVTTTLSEERPNRSMTVSALNSIKTTKVKTKEYYFIRQDNTICKFSIKLSFSSIKQENSKLQKPCFDSMSLSLSQSYCWHQKVQRIF